jgi:hypothetical protein
MLTTSILSAENAFLTSTSSANFFIFLQPCHAHVEKHNMIGWMVGVLLLEEIDKQYEIEKKRRLEARNVPNA